MVLITFAFVTTETLPFSFALAYSNARRAMLASHCSAEAVARQIRQELGVHAVLDAGLKLGEGTGAVCMMPLLDMALAVYCDSAGFADAGVGQYTVQKGDRR